MLLVISVFTQCYLLEKLENFEPEIVDHAKYIWYTSTFFHSQMSKIWAEEKVNSFIEMRRMGGGGERGLSLKLIFISLPKKRVVFTVGWGKKVLVTFNASKTQI